jgi:circadian clock protein KaiC
MLQKTHITELDEILRGGIPQGSTVALLGQPGAGKTVLALQWLFTGYQDAGEPGLYIGFTESTAKAIANAKQFEFFSQANVAPDKVHFVDLRDILRELGFADGSMLLPDQMEQVVDVIRHLVDQMKAKRVVLDSLTGLLMLLDNTSGRRNFVFRLGNALSRIGATMLMTCESAMDGAARFGVAEYIADGIIQLSNDVGQQSMVRRLNVLKMRGSNFRSGPVVFDITSSGVMVYPKVPSYTSTAKTDFDHRRSIGVPTVDQLLGGGIPQGHIMLIGGNTGTGKSTLGLHFIAEGIKQGETAVIVALEESVEQVKKTADQHGWDLAGWEKEGKVAFVTAELIDINPDRLLYDIINTTTRLGAKRVVIDSVSSMENAAFDRTRIREFLLQILAYFKSAGITCVMTYLTAELFGAGADQLMSGTASTELGLSSMVDGIILLRYVEREQRVRKLMNILKLRGSEHEKGIIEYAIGREGVVIGERFER